MCADILADGALQTVAKRATQYVSDETWKALTKNSSAEDCEDISLLARTLLERRKGFHRVVGQGVGFLVGSLGANDTVVAFAEEFASRLPLALIDAKLFAVARALQITGIVLCLLNGLELADCPCLIDILRREGELHLKALTLQALEDWGKLPQSVPRTRT